MHGWHYHHRPSRFLWFTFGAIVASCFIKHREATYHGSQGKHWGPFGHCSRSQIPQEAYGQPQNQREYAQKWEWARPNNDTAAAGAGVAAPGHAAGGFTHPAPVEKAAPPPSPLPGSLPAQSDPWEEEKQRLASISKQASDMLAEYSEAGIDSLLGTMETLKAKIAERRAQRERELREQQELEALREEKLRQFEEWRRQQEEAAKESRRRLV